MCRDLGVFPWRKWKPNHITDISLENLYQVGFLIYESWYYDKEALFGLFICIFESWVDGQHKENGRWRILLTVT